METCFRAPPPARHPSSPGPADATPMGEWLGPASRSQPCLDRGGGAGPGTHFRRRSRQNHHCDSRGWLQLAGRLLLVHGAAVQEPARGGVGDRLGTPGGRLANPTYEQVSSGETRQAVPEVGGGGVLDPGDELREACWMCTGTGIDPTPDRGQFCDWGSQYRTAIFYHDERQKRLALASRDAAGAR